MREGSTKLGPFHFQLLDAGLEFEYPADGGQRHALADEFHHVLNDGNLVARVAALPARRAGRPYHPELVEPPQESLLDFEHPGDLPDREQWQILVIERQ